MLQHRISRAATGTIACAIAALLLGACGGGDKASDDRTLGSSAAATGAVAVATTARAVALSAPPSAAAVPPLQAASQLMNEAERLYAQYFSGPAQPGSLPPFEYRYYPQTGIYLGVVVTPGLGYTNAGVYVMGGAFGNAPAYVGLVTDFITPVAGPSSAAACFDLDLRFRTGTKFEQTYLNTEPDGKQTPETVDELVVGPATFEGRAVVQVDGKQTAPGFQMLSKAYVERTGVLEMTSYAQQDQYSIELGFGLPPATGTELSRYAPPWVDMRYGLALGASIDTVIAATVTALQGQPSSSSFSEVRTTRFIGTEQVTVPAGTFETCRFEETDSTVPGTLRTEWYVVGSGMLAQSKEVSSQGTKLKRATALKLNGVALTGVAP